MMRDIFITSNNFLDYMSEAVSVYVASAYLNRTIIDGIKSNLEKLPFHGGRNFRFLLNQDFHQDPQMRKVLINMLLELPNTQVRVYKGDKFFHPKLYLFESGNNVFVAVGSFNATAGGAGRNIEAGVKLHDREIYRQAKEYFDRYWDSEFTEKATYDETAVFIEKKFKPGDPVDISSSKQRGVILNAEPEQYDNEWHYSVFSQNSAKTYPESDLSHVRILNASNLPDDFDESDVSVSDWFRNYILEKVFNLPEKALASYGSSRTETYPYQFRPLLKMIHSSDHRLLIADEVGLGKTIEAGIILKEFLFRMRMNRILVIVPNSLRTKWRDELRIRFDEYYDIINKNDLMSFIDDYSKSPDSASIKGIITYDQLASRQFLSQLNSLSQVPAFDMVIIDEAHHLKNELTLRHSVIKKLTKNSYALILMTATPVQLKTRDLFNLLTILLPKYSEDSRAFSARLVLNERLNEAIRKLDNKKYEEFKQGINEIRSIKAFQKQLEYFEESGKVFEDCMNINDGVSEKQIFELRSKLYNFNVLNRNISRTLRRDAGLRFPERVVSTQLYEYSPEEKVLYSQIISNCEKYVSKNNRLVLVSIERQAASSLFAFYKDINKSKYLAGFNEYVATLESVEAGHAEKNSTLGMNQEANLTANIKRMRVPDKDSKLEMLTSIIDGIFSSNKQESHKKVLIFCTFISTIDYLQTSLSLKYPNINVEVLTGSDDLSQRDTKRKNFRDKLMSILICSEVAGEGLDFQFCHYLVNYDMPWNPSKLEQRVGRIDRIGQSAEKITIINLVNKYTIEDYIIAKLFERVKIFNNSLGPLGEVLGEIQNEFSVNVLRADRTEKEKEEYEKRVSAKLLAKQKDQQQLDENQVELFGILDYFYDEELKRQANFTENEIEFIWISYLKSVTNVSYKDVVKRLNNGLFELTVTDGLNGILRNIVELGTSGILNKRKRDHYKDVLHNSATLHAPIRYTFNQRNALDDLTLEFLTIGHPYINGALQCLQSDYKPNKVILFCKGVISGLKPGMIIIFIFRFEIQSMDKAANDSHSEERAFIYSLQEHVGLWQSTAIISDLIGHVQNEEESKDIVSVIKGLNQTVQAESQRVGDNILKEYSNRSIIDLERKRDSLNVQYDVRIKQYRTNLQFTQDPYNRDRIEREIERLNGEKAERLLGLQSSQYRIVIHCTGIMVLNNEVT